MTVSRNDAKAPNRMPRYPARKTPIGELIIWVLVRSAMRRMFARVRVRIDGDHPRDADMPLVAIANHPSWWDGYIALALSRHFGLRRYLMMDAAQLRRYGFFAWAGCFGVDRTDPKDVARTMTYAADLLAGDRAPLLWMFPQAEIVPHTRRPVVVHGGTAHILRRALHRRPAIGVLPVAWQLIFRGEQHPEIVVRTGPVLRIEGTAPVDYAGLSALLEEALTSVMDCLQADVTGNDFEQYFTIMRGREGVNDRFDRLLRRSRLVPDP
jgi:chlorobactene lauroyltransferase